jgi:hypothetical protein
VSALCTELQHFLTGESDLSRRRELARNHAQEPSAGAHAALAHGDLEARRRALSHASQAVALDLENREARATILELLIQPPDSTPPEVERELDAATSSRRRSSSAP